MKSVLRSVISRRRVYSIGLAWGCAVLCFIGIVSGRLQQASVKVGIIADTEYHRHVSSVLTVFFALLILLLLGVKKSSSARGFGLSHLFGALCVYDFLAVGVGSTLALIIGWGKEVTDAMGGKFISSTDVNADMNGIIAVAIPAMVALLVSHGLVALVGDAVYVWVVWLITPPKSRDVLNKAHHVHSRIMVNNVKIDKEKTQAESLESEIRQLEEQWHQLPSEARSGSSGNRIKNRMQERQKELEKYLARIAELESENLHLRNDLEAAMASLKDSGGEAHVEREIEDAIAGAMCQQAAASALKERAISSLKRTADLMDLPIPEVVADLESASDSAVVATPEPVPVESPSPVAAVPQADSETVQRLEEKAARAGEALKLREKQIGEMESEIGYLKARIDGMQSAPENSAEAMQALEERNALLRRHVLIVDDDHAFLRMVSKVLGKTGLIEARTADSVIDAIKLLRETHRRPDLIVLDIKMPKFSGIELYRAMEKSRSMRQIPIIFCSGCREDSLPELGELQYAAYIQKPFPITTLLELIYEWLGLGEPGEV